MNGRKPTIDDVARRAFVSKTTVSHVLNGTRFVAPETEQRVREAIAELGYRPSAVARSLTTKRTGTVGMVIADASNQYAGEVLRGAEDFLQPMNYGLIVCSTDDVTERESHYLSLLLSLQVEGIIAGATSRKWQELLRAEATHTPVVFIGRIFEGMQGPYVGVENYSGFFQATRHLIESGRRRLGVISGFLSLSTMYERLEGVKAAMAEAGMPLLEERIVFCPLDVEAARKATWQILSLTERPDALLIGNNQLSLGALLALKEAGLRCPEDLALIGFDDHPWAQVSDPPLSVVRQPSRKIGQVAAEILCKMIERGELTSSSVRLGCELVLRQSCCPSHPA